MIFEKEDYSSEPYSPYVKQRETLDNGFSKGWGFYFHPNEEYWFDVHSHLGPVKSHSELYKLLDEWFARLDAFRLGRLLLISPLPEDPDKFEIYRNLTNQDARFNWIFRMNFDRPDLDLFKKALECKAIGLKLHNSPIMKGQASPDIWLGNEWSRIFSLAEEKNIPVLWHVTQRVSRSPYHGGGENAYWSEGWKKGVKFTNEDLLQVCLKLLEKYKNLKIIGAHQFYVGLDRLASLFESHENLFVDTSVGFYLRWADDLYENDREILRNFFIKYQDRILFGSDSILTPGGIDEYLVQAFLCHARFISKLRLPYDVLEKVAHKNTEKLFGLKTMTAERRGNARP